MSLAREQLGLVSGEGEAMKYPASTGTVQPFQSPPYHMHYHVIRNCEGEEGGRRGGGGGERGRGGRRRGGRGGHKKAELTLGRPIGLCMIALTEHVLLMKGFHLVSQLGL